MRKQNQRKLQHIFAQEEAQALREQVWWVGCPKQPYLVKAAIVNQNILLAITNLKEIWAVRIQESKLKADKQIYAKTLQISGQKQLLALFQSLLVNPEKKAEYVFKTNENSQMIFRLYKNIEVYPFQWKFQLDKMNEEIIPMICKELLNPLICTVSAQQKRITLLKRKLQNLEKQHIRKLSELERSSYRSQIQQDPDDWKLLLPQTKSEQLMSLKMDSVSKYFFLSSLKQQTVRKQPQPIVATERTRNVSKMLGLDASKPDELINELQLMKNLQREKQKPKKKLDFI